MPKRDDEGRLRDMLEYSREAVASLQGMDREDLRKSRMLELSLARLVEILGEAAARISEERQKQHSNIPWRDIIDMRNRLIHGYDSVDVDVLWDTVMNDLPDLIGALEAILE